MSEIPKCFELIEAIDTERIMPLSIQYFKSNLKMQYSNIKALNIIMGLNNWHDSDFEVTEDYFNSIPAEPISCCNIISGYENNGISNYCYICKLSKEYKNHNLSEEEAIVSYLINNPALIDKTNIAGIGSAAFHSVLLYKKSDKSFTLPMLSKFYNILITQGIEPFSENKLQSTISNLVSEHEPAIKIALDYYISLRDTSISKERVIESLNIVCGAGAANTIFPQNTAVIARDAVGPLTLETEKTELKEGYFTQNSPTQIGQQYAFLPDTNKSRRRSRTNVPNIPQEKKSTKQDSNDETTISPEQLTLESLDNDVYNSEVKLDDDIVLVQSLGKEKSTVATGKVDNNKVDNIRLPVIPVSEPIDVPFKAVLSLHEYIEVQTVLLTSRKLFMSYYSASGTLLVFNTSNDAKTAYIINMNDKKIRQEIGLLFISPSLTKIVDNVMSLGALYGNDVLRFKSIFEIQSAEYILSGNTLFLSTFKKRLEPCQCEAFDLEKWPDYTMYMQSILNKYNAYSKELEQKQLTKEFSNQVTCALFLAISLNVILDDRMKRNVLTGRLIDDNKVQFASDYAAGLPINKNTPVISWVTENALIAILSSKLVNLTDVRLAHLSNSSIALDVDNKFLPAAFDVLNQHMVNTFKNMIDTKFSPTVLMNINYKNEQDK